MHPIPTLYIIIAVPVATPVTTPVELATLAVPGAEELHVPPVVAHKRVMVLPAHTVKDAPVMGANGLTVAVAVTKQPVGNMYDIVVVPVNIPVIVPVGLIVPTNGLLLLHTPPPVASVSVVVLSTHTDKAPAIAAGNGLTVNSTTVIHPVPK
jgi:hypothetical protein